jgi:spermidine synthase
MNPWIHIDTAPVPGGADLRLMKRGDDFSIMAGRIELMNTRLFGSEKALATLSCEHIAGRKAPRLLIGGLGMGFTLRAALAVLPADAQIVVCELVPAVNVWARGPMAALHAGTLDDPRVLIRVADVGAEMRAADRAYDAILLDVDNGPDGLTRAENDGLYSHQGLSTARRALKAGGVLAVWSSASDRGFTQRLRQSGFEVEEKRVRAGSNGGGARHTIWLASAGPSPVRPRPKA